jgi:hypothetical protein
VTHGKENIMNSTLTTISLLIKVPQKDISELPVEAQNELIAAYEMNTEDMNTVEIIEELKRLYVHHETEKLLSDVTECFDFEPEVLRTFPDNTLSEMISVWESTHDLEEVYPIIQREIQISSLNDVCNLLGVTSDELREKYSYDTLSQICGAYDMTIDVEPKSYIIKELNSIMRAAV